MTQLQHRENLQFTASLKPVRSARPDRFGRAHQHLLTSVALGAVTLFHWRRWQKDRRLALTYRTARAGVNAEPQTDCVSLAHDTGEPELVSVLIAAWNEESNLRACIESVQSLRYPHKELILCVGGADRTRSIAQEYAGENATRVVVLEQQPGEGKQRALRKSFAHAKGDIIYLMDADCVTDDVCFESALRPILTGEEEAVAGAWQPFSAQRTRALVDFQWTHHLYRHLHAPTYVHCFDGRNAVVRRCALERTGALAVDAPIGTDYVQSKQLLAADVRIRALPQSRIQTAYPDTFGDYWRQQSRWFRSPLILGLKHKEWNLVFTQVRAGLSALLLLAIPLLGGLRNRPLRTSWTLAVAHLLLGQWRLTRFAQVAGQMEETSVKWVVLFPFYMLISWVAMARGIVESLFSNRKWRW